MQSPTHLRAFEDLVADIRDEIDNKANVRGDKVGRVPRVLEEHWESLEDTDDKAEDGRKPCRIRLENAAPVHLGAEASLNLHGFVEADVGDAEHA